MPKLNITKDTPRRARTIGGVLVQVPAPITAETPMNEQFAQMLNQTIAENFSNNLRDRVSKFVPEGAKEGTAPRTATVAEAQSIVDSYATAYEPGVRSGGGGGRQTLTPVEREMRNIAQEKLNSLLAEQNIKRSQLPKDGDGSYRSLVDQIVGDHEDALKAQAERIVAARESATSKAGVDLSGLKVAAAKPAPAPAPASGEGGAGAPAA